MRTIRTRTPLVAMGVLLAVYVGSQLAGLRINTTASMPRGLYRVVGGSLRRGAIVAACLPAEVARLGMERHYLGPGGCPGGAEPVVKRLAAVAGDVVEVTGEGVLVDGAALPCSRPLAEDHGSRPLEPFAPGPHRLASDEVWLYSPYEARSWDSRYFGPIPAENVLHVVAPVLTFP